MNLRVGNRVSISQTPAPNSYSSLVQPGMDEWALLARFKDMKEQMRHQEEIRQTRIKQNEMK